MISLPQLPVVEPVFKFCLGELTLHPPSWYSSFCKMVYSMVYIWRNLVKVKRWWSGCRSMSCNPYWSVFQYITGFEFKEMEIRAEAPTLHIWKKNEEGVEDYFPSWLTELVFCLVWLSEPLVTPPLFRPPPFNGVSHFLTQQVPYVLQTYLPTTNTTTINLTTKHCTSYNEK